MAETLKDSIKGVFTERISSPFYGALIVSWLLWNWKIVYLTLFVSEAHLGTSKLHYIMDNYNEPLKNYIFPITSTIIIITIFPLLNIGAIYITARYKRYKENLINDFERRKRLTEIESIELKESLETSRQEFRSSLLSLQDDNKELRFIIQDMKARSQGLRILKATYGSTEANKIDVTHVLRGKVINDRLSFMLNNESLNGVDPAFGQVKTLQVFYEMNNIFQFSKFNENTAVNLP